MSDHGDTFDGGFARQSPVTESGAISGLGPAMRRHWRLLALVFAGAFAFNFVWFLVGSRAPMATVIFPLNALTVVLALRAVRTNAGATAVITIMALGVVISNILLRGFGSPWVLFPLCGTAEVVLVFLAARRLGLTALGGANLKQTALFALVAGVVAPAVSACLGTVVVALGPGHQPLALVFMFWWSCNSLGEIILLPLGLGLTRASLARLRSPRMRWEAVGAAVAVIGSALLIFHIGQGTVWTLLVAPGLVYATFRFGLPGAAVANFLAAAMAIGATSLGYGPLANLGRTSYVELAGLLQVFLALCWFVTLPPAYLLESFAAELRTREDRLVESQMLAADAQNRMLRYQLDPHFFFNTLTALSSLIQERETEKADLMVVALSAFLRHSLQQSPTDKVALCDEVGAQERYLQIEQIRFGERLQWTSRVSALAARIPVPVFILQPLFENAIKHAVATTTKAVHLELSAGVQSGVLTVSLSDDGHGGTPAQAKLGVGLDNVRRRLALIYGLSASLTVGKRKPRGYSAVIRIPIEDE